MCHGYPAPRCSRHALNLLEDARAELEGSVSWADKEQAERKLRKAEEAFYMTPAGFASLEERIETEPNPLVKDELFAKLVEGKNRRKEALRNAAHVKRVNKEQLTKAKEMRSTGLSSWVIASQLNIEFLEASGKEVSKEIDVKNKHFVLDVDGIKVLSISNKYSLDLGEYEPGHSLEPVLDVFKNRGYNAPINSEELTFQQKNIVWDYVLSVLKDKGIQELLVCDPRIGYSVSVPVDEAKNKFNLIVYTPNPMRTGTDNLPAKSVDDFVNSFNHSLVGLPERVDKQIIIETEETLDAESLYVGEKYYLTHLRDNFYSVKKLGNITGYTIRCVLVFSN